MSKRQEIFLIAFILLIAAFFRLYRLNELPPGMHYDEAFNATMAQHVLAGVERPLVFTEDLTEEPMAIYTASIFFWLFGASPFALRLVSAFVGILTVAALCFCAGGLRPIPQPPSLPGNRTRRLGVLAPFIFAILYWHINFSRLGMEPIFLPLVLTLGVGFLLRAMTPTSTLARATREGAGWGWWALAGLFLALTQYTYKAALFVPIFVGAFLASEIIFNRDFFARHARGLGIFSVVAVLAFAPLGLYWAMHPDEFFERPSSVLAQSSAIINNLTQVGAMFFLRGDENPRSNLPGRAVLDPLLAIGFMIGIVVCLVRFKQREPRVMLTWLGGMVLPSVFSDFAPHFGRSIAAAPAVALVTAYGISVIRGKIRSRASYYFLLLISAFSAFSTFNDYFNVWGSRTGHFDSFDVGLLSLARKLRAQPGALYLTPRAHEHYTLQFGLAGADAHIFDGAHVIVLPQPNEAATYAVITRHDPRTLGRLQKIFPQGRVVEIIYDFTAQPYAVIYRAEGSPQWTPQKRVDARVGEKIALIGYDAVRTGNEIALTIYWVSTGETRADYTVFAHLVDVDGKVISQDDAQPGHRSYPTSRWRAGQVIADDYRLSAPPQARGEFQIEIGMYVLETGARLRLTDANGAQMENDRVLVERFAFP